jgi:hypothetical protein
VRKKSSISRKRGLNVISEVKCRDFDVLENQVYTG